MFSIVLGFCLKKIVQKLQVLIFAGMTTGNLQIAIYGFTAPVRNYEPAGIIYEVSLWNAIQQNGNFTYFSHSDSFNPRQNYSGTLYIANLQKHTRRRSGTLEFTQKIVGRAGWAEKRTVRRGQWEIWKVSDEVGP